MKLVATRAKKSHSAPAARSNGGKARRFANDPPSMDEPCLRDMLKDPILLTLMRSDKVEPTQLQTLLDDTRARLFD